METYSVLPPRDLPSKILCYYCVFKKKTDVYYGHRLFKRQLRKKGHKAESIFYC